MILYAVIFRMLDGLPLVATTDVTMTKDVKECQKYIKSLSKRLNKYEDRCILHLSGYTVQFISALGLTFLALCEESYPRVMAFCFLDEVQKEFIVRYTSDQLEAVKRPYAFLEYEVYLKKTKNRYNSPRTLSARVNLSVMSTELRLRPPHVITEDEMVISNGFHPNSPTYRQSQSIPVRLSSHLQSVLDWQAGVSIAVNMFCALIHLIRGMIMISHGHFDDMDKGTYTNGSAFIATSILNFYQIYLMVSYMQRKRLYSALVLILICALQYILFCLRNEYQVAFYIIAATYATYIIWRRKPRKRLPGYDV